MSAQLSPTGIWSGELRYGDQAEAAEVAAELESLGYGAMWVPDIGGDVFGVVANLLGATQLATIATGILNLWMHTAEETAEGWNALSTEHGRRFLLGIGVSHQPLIDHVKEPGAYRRPLEQMEHYLDGLDAAPAPVPADQRVLAALGPKMLHLAKTRTAGTHPYLVTPEHTAAARDALGAGPIVAVEQGVVLDADPASARTAAREHLARYLPLPNYSNNWRRVGFTDDDFADGGSDRFVDALVAWGDESAIAARVEEHRGAGADHVCVQVLGARPGSFPLDVWRALAPALT